MVQICRNSIIKRSKTIIQISIMVHNEIFVLLREQKEFESIEPSHV